MHLSRGVRTHGASLITRAFRGIYEGDTPAPGGDGAAAASPTLKRPGTFPKSRNLKVPELTNVELVQLRVRVIALENLVISLLAEASDRQLDLAREMAVFISPRPGFTHHPLTIHAATQMIDLVDRAGYFRRAKL